jgi:hypothetical protein
MSFKSYERNAAAIESDGQNRLVTSLKNGKTTVRIMPPYSERGVWFKKVNEYYFNLGGQHLYFPSPRDFALPDPIWDYCESVYESDDQEAIAKVKEWKPTLRYLMNAFILSEPNPIERKDLVVLKVPSKVQKELKSLDTDSAAGYGDITNLEKGFSITISKEGKGISTTYTVTCHRNETNAFDILKERGLDLSTMTLHNLDEVYPPKSFDEMTQILETLKSSGQSVQVTDRHAVKVDVVQNKVQVPEFEPIVVEAPPKA